ncbi:MAG: hypothetical protein B6I33_08620 [Propionibacterium sp. 4572_24]|nr:MAG: hypothetical protein B6I33_08620 [Propionibacterium sp. 4572_24]
MLRRASLIFLFYHRSWGGVRLRPCRLRVWRDEGLPEITGTQRRSCTCLRCPKGELRTRHFRS